MKNFFEKVTLPYLVYLMYFLGVGFLSGAIVHYPVNPGLYGGIGVVGVVIFTLASTLNEWITNKRHLLHAGVLRIVLYSLILSIGLGMISGGIQHFIDFPVYASYLIPAGLVVSLVGFVLNREIKLDIRDRLFLVFKLSLITIPLLLILNTWAKTMEPAGNAHGHGRGHGQSVHASKESSLESQEPVHHAIVQNDEEFIYEMIPHHQEAITTSEYLISKVNNEELKIFAAGILKAQTIEVDQMKEYYKEWFGREYEENTNYKKMMGNLTNYNNEKLEKEYIKGMIVHHKGAVDMAKQMVSITARPEVKKMAEDIIKLQSQEVSALQNMLEGYDHEEWEH